MRPEPQAGELIGRARELDLLAGAISDNRGAVLLGEPGSGKTTLMRAAAAASGRSILEGGALATLAWMPYLAIERAIGRKLPESDTAWVVAEVQDSLGAGVLLVDDLQWADPSTLAVVLSLAGRVPLIATLRSGDPSTPSVLDDLRTAAFDVVDVPVLSEDDALEFARRRRPDLSRAAIERVCRRAGGNPFYIEELIATPEPSETLRLAVRTRMRALPEGARRLMATLSLAGRPMSLPGSADAAVLVTAGLADVTDDAVALRHALLAEIVADELGQRERREIHEELADLADDPGEAAHHWSAAGDRARAYETALVAAATTTSPEQRAEHLGLAAAWASGRSAETLRIRAAVALADVGRHEASDALLREAEPADADDRRWVHLIRARNAWALGDPERAGAELSTGLAIDGKDVTEARIGLVIEEARLEAFTGRHAAAIEMARAAVAAAREHEISEARAEYVLGTAYVLAGSDDAVPHLTEAMHIARRLGEHDVELRAGSNLVAAHQRANRAEDVHRTLNALAQRARELRLLAWERTFRADSILHRSESDPSVQIIQECEALLAEILDARTRAEIDGVLCQTLIAVGRLDEASSRIERSLDTATDDWMGRGRLLCAKAWALFWGGRSRDALDAIDDALLLVGDDPATAAVARSVRAWICYDLGRDPGEPIVAEVELGRRHASDAAALKNLHDGDARAAAEIFQRAVEESSAPIHVARALWGAGESWRIAGETDTARERLLTAESLAERHDLRPLLARIRRSLRLLGERRGSARTQQQGELTGREREILQLVGRGLTNTQIAGRLGLTRATVERHVANACVKLGAANRAQAAMLVASS